jgi:hypothetical protein
MAEAEQRRQDHENTERRKREDMYGEIGEQAAHALRKDLGVKTKAFIE